METVVSNVSDFKYENGSLTFYHEKRTEEETFLDFILQSKRNWKVIFRTDFDVVPEKFYLALGNDYPSFQRVLMYLLHEKGQRTEDELKQALDVLIQNNGDGKIIGLKSIQEILDTKKGKMMTITLYDGKERIFVYYEENKDLFSILKEKVLEVSNLSGADKHIRACYTDIKERKKNSTFYIPSGVYRPWETLFELKNEILRLNKINSDRLEHIHSLFDDLHLSVDYRHYNLLLLTFLSGEVMVSGFVLDDEKKKFIKYISCNEDEYSVYIDEDTKRLLSLYIQKHADKIRIENLCIYISFLQEKNRFELLDEIFYTISNLPDSTSFLSKLEDKKRLYSYYLLPQFIKYCKLETLVFLCKKSRFVIVEETNIDKTFEALFDNNTHSKNTLEERFNLIKSFMSNVGRVVHFYNVICRMRKDFFDSCIPRNYNIELLEKTKEELERM